MAAFALIMWPFLTVLLAQKLPFPKVVLFSIIGGFLLLPARGGIDLPILPPFDKHSIPSMTVLALGLMICGFNAPKRIRRSSDEQLDLPGWLPKSPIAIAGLVLILVGAQMTVLTNTDTLVYGPTVLQAMRPYDGFSIALAGYTVLIPLLIGRKFFGHPDRHHLLLVGVVAGGLFVSLLALYEIRMSPQLSNIIYGFFPHSWAQHIRNDGWRPVVFMQHGLQLTLFLALTAVAAFGLARVATPHRRMLYLLAGLWLLGTVILSNSFGALIIALGFILPLVLLGPRQQLAFAALIACAVVTYPMLRSLDLVPTDQLVAAARAFSEDRASSLQFRFNNEDLLVTHSMQRPLFGWGIFGRGRVFTDEGVDAVVTDGYWIVALSKEGWTGYLTIFGFLTLPIVQLAWFRDRYEVSPTTIVLCLVVAAALVDLIPNGFLSPVTVLVVGALWGRLELERAISSDTAHEAQVGGSRRHAFARQRLEEEHIEPDSGPTNRRPRYTRQTRLHDRFKRSN